LSQKLHWFLFPNCFILKLKQNNDKAVDFFKFITSTVGGLLSGMISGSMTLGWWGGIAGIVAGLATNNAFLVLALPIGAGLLGSVAGGLLGTIRGMSSGLASSGSPAQVAEVAPARSPARQLALNEELDIEPPRGGHVARLAAGRGQATGRGIG